MIQKPFILNISKISSISLILLILIYKMTKYKYVNDIAMAYKFYKGINSKRR
ncbi:hypothetical protein HBA_0488 [Sodalis endosymbiont of Henestaris halophilus]|nr:hypothetical protein HBA_0488 [Sodalis endosymbiont of Henestaris halophilus]